LLDMLKQYEILAFLSLQLNLLGADYRKRHKTRYVKTNCILRRSKDIGRMQNR